MHQHNLYCYPISLHVNLNLKKKMSLIAHANINHYNSVVCVEVNYSSMQ